MFCGKFRLFKFKIGKKQQVGVMSVFFNYEDESVITFEDIDFIGTDDYGEMVFKIMSPFTPSDIL